MTNTADLITFTAGPIGAKITTPGAPGLFLANFLMGPSNIGSVTVQLVNAGTVVFAHTGGINILEPEPTSTCLMFSALAAGGGAPPRRVTSSSTRQIRVHRLACRNPDCSFNNVASNNVNGLMT